MDTAIERPPPGLTETVDRLEGNETLDGPVDALSQVGRGRAAAGPASGTCSGAGGWVTPCTRR